MAETLSETRACSFCNIEKPLEQFHYRNKLTGKRYIQCKVCQQAKQIAYVKRKNPFPKAGWKSLTTDMREDILRARARGASIKTISDNTGISCSKLYHYRKEGKIV